MRTGMVFIYVKPVKCVRVRVRVSVLAVTTAKAGLHSVEPVSPIEAYPKYPSFILQSMGS